jgi:predicted DNA-binding WGR domain protein
MSLLINFGHRRREGTSEMKLFDMKPKVEAAYDLKTKIES